MIQRLYLLFLAVIMLALSGCGGQMGTWGAASTIPLEQGNYETLGPVKGESCVYYLLSIIPLGEFNNTGDALRDALSKKPGATALVQVTTDTRNLLYIIVAEACTIVEGIAVKEK